MSFRPGEVLTEDIAVNVEGKPFTIFHLGDDAK